MQYVGTTYRLIQGEGLWGLSPVKSIDFKGFKAPTGPEPIPPPRGKKNKINPPPTGHITEDATGEETPRGKHSPVNVMY